jgi:U3-containing 90S pre-ribosomal complex subunit
MCGRALRKFQTKDSVVAKLFAKHIKLQESIDLCKKKRYVVTFDILIYDHH